MKILRHPLAFAALAAALLVSLFATLPGCATFGTGQNAVFQQVAVQYAVGKFIEAKPEAQRVERAVQVKSIAKAVSDVAGNPDATADTLYALALEKINGASLSPADYLLATTVLAAVSEELKTRVNHGILSPESRVAVDRVLGWVIGAATAYGAP